MTTAKLLHLKSVDTTDTEPRADTPATPDELAAHACLAVMLDALDVAGFGVEDVLEALRSLYREATLAPAVEKFVAFEAEHKDIVNHLEDASCSLRAVRGLVRSNYGTLGPEPV